MSLGLTAMLTGNEGREKKEKKTTKRAAAAATEEKGAAHRATVGDSEAEHSHDVDGAEERGGGRAAGTETEPRRQRRAVVIQAEQKEKARLAQAKAEEQATRARRKGAARPAQRSAAPSALSSPPSLSSPPARPNDAPRGGARDTKTDTETKTEQERSVLKAEASGGGEDAVEHINSYAGGGGACDGAMSLLAAALGLTPPSDRDRDRDRDSDSDQGRDVASTSPASPLEMAAAAATTASAMGDGDGAATASDAAYADTCSGTKSQSTAPAQPVLSTAVVANSKADGRPDQVSVWKDGPDASGCRGWGASGAAACSAAATTTETSMVVTGGGQTRLTVAVTSSGAPSADAAVARGRQQKRGRAGDRVGGHIAINGPPEEPGGEAAEGHSGARRPKRPRLP